MSKKLKKRLIRIIIVGALFVPIFVLDKIFDLSSLFWGEVGWIFPLILYLSLYFVIAYDILIKAFKNIRHGQVFDENFLMIVATIGAFAIKEFPEAVMVMLLYQIGEFFQDLAVGKSRKSIADLMEIRPDFAFLLDENGNAEEVDPELVNIGDIIRIEPGEKVPLDGIIIKGASSLDNKALTGESLPLDVKEGDEILSGSINLSSTIEVKVTKEFKDSTVNKILELVENSTNVKSKPEKFITVFAKWYTPIVVISAVLLALIGSLITQDWVEWVSRSLNFLVVSCPCAIVISVPLCFFISIGKAAKTGILIKGSSYLENFNKAKTYVFDKTGTLTKGNFKVTKVVPEERREEILYLASVCEAHSSHPIALSICSLVDTPINNNFSIINFPGKGIVASNKGEEILCGNSLLLEDKGIKLSKHEENGTIVYVAKNGEYIGHIVIEDEIKENTFEVIEYLSSQKIETIMLTGDNDKVASSVANRLSLSSYRSNLLPQDKVSEMENILINKSNNELVAFVGDGINDAPTLARADIGISMGGIGSDAAIEASDIVLMNDDLSSLIKAKKIAKKAMWIVKENIIFAISVKLIILVLSSLGLASIWLAIFGDVGVALLCVLNALRSGRIKG